MALHLISIASFFTCVGVASSGGGAGLQFEYNENNGFKPGLQPDIFRRCWSEAGIPMAVALGNPFHWSYMCSQTYFQTCETSLPVALTQKAGLQPYQRDYVMAVILSWVKGGGIYLCNVGLTSIKYLMYHGGSDCIKDFAASRISMCNVHLEQLRTGTEYSDQYCRILDANLQCYIEAVSTCPNDELKDFLLEFFKNVIWTSPCKDSSIFTNIALPKCEPNVFIFTLLILITFVYSTLSR